METKTQYISPYGDVFSNEESANLQIEIQRIKTILFEMQKELDSVLSKCTHVDNYVSVSYSEYSERYTYTLTCKTCGTTNTVRKREEVPKGSEFR